MELLLLYSSFLLLLLLPCHGLGSAPQDQAPGASYEGGAGEEWGCRDDDDDDDGVGGDDRLEAAAV